MKTLMSAAALTQSPSGRRWGLLSDIAASNPRIWLLLTSRHSLIGEVQSQSGLIQRGLPMCTTSVRICSFSAHQHRYHASSGMSIYAHKVWKHAGIRKSGQPHAITCIFPGFTWLPESPHSKRMKLLTQSHFAQRRPYQCHGKEKN